MAEDLPLNFDSKAEARRIVSGYLNRLGWARQWRLSAERLAEVGRDEREARQRNIAVREEQAEEQFGREVDFWRREPGPAAREVLREIVNLTEGRNDLSFLGRQVVQRIKRELS